MPTRNLKVALIPHSITLENKDENLKRVSERLSTIDPDTDLVVLPELFNTGYTADRPTLLSLSEDNDGPTIRSVRRWAKHFGFAIWGGFTARDGENLYNRGFMIEPGGEANFYDKRHLFRSGYENQVFMPGMKASPIVRFRSWNLKMAICYDIRFPVWNRIVANEYDALIVPANWAHARVFAWKHMLIARAIENQAYVAGCNREGSDMYGDYPAGDSFIFNNWGDDVAERRNDGVVYSTFDAEKLNIDRRRFAPWRDSDTFKLIID